MMAIIGGLVAGLLWGGYSSIKTDVDWLTSLMIIGMPLFFILARKPLDYLLLPFQSFRRWIPRLVIVGMGLAVPFVVAYVLYNTFGVRNFPLARKAMIIGTPLSYLILRTPKIPRRLTRHVHRASMLSSGIVAILAVLVPATIVCADDFLRDPLDLEDGLRTDGIAEIIAGAAAVVVSVLVNGNEIIQTLLNPRRPVGETAPPDPNRDRTHFRIDIRTEDQRNTLVADDEDTLAISARVLCNRPDANTDGPTNALAFTVSGPDANWLVMTRPQMTGSSKTVTLRARPPTPEAELTSGEATVTVSTMIEGRQFSAPIVLSIFDEYGLEIEIID